MWEVIDEPVRSDSTGWGWSTRVRLAAKHEPGEPGVPLADLGVSTKSLGRRVRLRFDDDQRSRLERAFGL